MRKSFNPLSVFEKKRNLLPGENPPGVRADGSGGVQDGGYNVQGFRSVRRDPGVEGSRKPDGNDDCTVC
jgi:hypothetical protein